jgi:hypothetical protein
VKLFVLLFALFACSGCGLWDVLVEINGEIGFSEEEFAKSRPKQPKVEETQVAGAKPKSELQRRTETWWKNASTLGPAKKTGKDAMVRCRLGGSERFTRTRDCVAAGGTVL